MNTFDEALLEGEKRKAKESARNLLKLKKITDEEILYHSNLYSDSRYGRIRY